ncbi:hypothetical protein Ccrd_014830 [Cynara cardunculus var. scolymus]|uniref:Uncharacterized protein n=1 Tax=Cynara cardunculus var. scolymus TaxID=59895 RepID=A0A103YCZ8_CYNCS|nr:hypothetical protein Ccrd_014830 [Cynara cardunculus var. scolymus]
MMCASICLAPCMPFAEPIDISMASMDGVEEPNYKAASIFGLRKMYLRSKK